jgi:GNAT superfamily N-acetyltransferase
VKPNPGSAEKLESRSPELRRDYAIRPAQGKDLDHLVQLLLALQDHLEASNPDLWRAAPSARMQFKSQVASRLAARNAFALVAEHKTDGIVGVIFGRIVMSKRYSPSRTGVVDQVYVAPHHRRAAVGARLVAELCHGFEEQGIDDLSLRFVVGNEEAARFWESLGFAPRILTVGATRKTVQQRLAQFLSL